MSTTRRVVLAGMGASACCKSATATPEADPIFAAIEAHRAAVMRMLRASDVSSNMHSAVDPRFPAADAVTGAAWAACHDAAEALVEIRPTTLAGVVALLAHVRRFDGGGFTFGSGYTEAELWPAAPFELPFGHRVLHMVGEVLAGGVA